VKISDYVGRQVMGERATVGEIGLGAKEGELTHGMQFEQA
jgi:hypothetical protein